MGFDEWGRWTVRSPPVENVAKVVRYVIERESQVSVIEVAKALGMSVSEADSALDKARAMRFLVRFGDPEVYVLGSSRSVDECRRWVGGVLRGGLTPPTHLV